LRFKQFLGSSFEPRITDAEIVVCFADVRGFTDYCRTLQKEMQDRKIQNFLRAFGRVFNEGLMKWFVEHLDPQYGKVDSDVEVIADYVVPTTYKNLGDGLMMVWEVPPHLDIVHQGILAQHIAFAVDSIAQMFYIRFRDLFPVELDAYSDAVQNLEVGFGIAKGHAWRLDYGHAVDYAGSIINLASRLEAKARPHGIVAHYDVSPWAFELLVSKKQGAIVDLTELKGYGSSVKAWCSPGVNLDQGGFEVSKSRGSRG